MVTDPNTIASERREWLLILLLLLIMLLKGVLWSIAFPLWQGPDEEDHYNVIQFIGELGRLPDAGDTYLIDEIALSRELADVGRLPYAPEQRQAFSDTAVGPGEDAIAALDAGLRSSFDLGMVGKLNKATPLYYIMASIPYRLFSGQTLLARAQTQRLFSLAMSAGIVVAAYLISRQLFPHRPALRLTIPILVAFQPMLSQMTAVVTVDGFFFLIYSILIFLSIRVFRDGLDWKLGAALAVVFSIGFLTKPTINGYAPLIALLVLYDFWRGKQRRKQIIIGTVVMGLIIVALTSWWMLRSLQINNDLFYFNPVLEGHRIIQNPFYDYGFFEHMIDYYQSVAGGIFVTWWAHFGWIDTPLPPYVYDLLRLLTAAAAAGLALLLWRSRANRPSFASWKSGLSGAPLVVWLFQLLIVLTPVLLLQIYDLTFWWQYGNGRGLQGRYWLGTAVPMLTLYTVGLLALVPQRWHGAAHNVLRAGMIVLNFAALLGYILPRYYL
jgi:4-amino-4-deoxy-L-arabinose transferase-like glycosyltransferase